MLIGRFIDCKAHAPYEGTAFVQHGKVTMKRTTMNQCGNPNEPATAYYYISDPGFKGIDEANFLPGFRVRAHRSHHSAVIPQRAVRSPARMF